MAMVLLCGGKSDTQDGNTALILAAEKGRTDFARLLINAGADMDAKNNVRALDLMRFLACL
jgi:ankyrin repeat protein